MPESAATSHVCWGALDAATLANVTVEAVAFAGSYGEAVLNGLAPKMGGVGGSGCGLVFLVDVQGGAACCTAVLGDDMMSRIAFIATPSATSSSAADDSGTSVGDAGVVKVVVQCMRMAHERLQEEGPATLWCLRSMLRLPPRH